MKRILLCLLALLTVPCGLDAKDKPVVFQDVTARGRMLEEYDQAAWHATDATLALKPDEGSVGRYIAQKTSAGWEVVFGRLNEGTTKFLVVYEATQGQDLKHFNLKKYDPPKENTGFYFAAAKAIGLALQEFHAENRPYNAYVLPQADQLYVYILPAQTKPDIYPLGGDARYAVSVDGATIIEKRQLHKTILENRASDAPEGTKIESGYHTHVLTDVPEDTDVFHVLTQNPPLPEYVGSAKNKHVYVIEIDGVIRRVE